MTKTIVSMDRYVEFEYLTRVLICYIVVLPAAGYALYWYEKRRKQ